jgi:hypothetical protein
VHDERAVFQCELPKVRQIPSRKCKVDRLAELIERTIRRYGEVSARLRLEDLSAASDQVNSDAQPPLSHDFNPVRTSSPSRISVKPEERNGWPRLVDNRASRLRRIGARGGI